MAGGYAVGHLPQLWQVLEGAEGASRAERRVAPGCRESHQAGVDTVPDRG